MPPPGGQVGRAKQMVMLAHKKAQSVARSGCSYVCLAGMPRLLSGISQKVLFFTGKKRTLEFDQRSS